MIFQWFETGESFIKEAQYYSNNSSTVFTLKPPIEMSSYLITINQARFDVISAASFDKMSTYYSDRQKIARLETRNGTTAPWAFSICIGL